MSRLFIDTNVPLYAAGGEHPLREPCQRLIRAIAAGELEAMTDVEVFQELLHRYFHIGQRQTGLLLFDHFHRIMLGHVLPIDDAILLRARELADEHPSLSPRDLVHLAVMERYQLQEIITADKGFENLAGIRRVSPEEF